jgi:hypothetical protein
MTRDEAKAARQAARAARHAAVYRMRDAGIKRRVIAKTLRMPVPTVDYLLYTKGGRSKNG